jgi:hypothetical protein
VKLKKMLEKVRNRDGRAAAERVERRLRDAAKLGTFKQALRKLAK